MITPRGDTTTKSLDYEIKKKQGFYSVNKENSYGIITEAEVVASHRDKVFEQNIMTTGSKNNKFSPQPSQEAITFRNDKIRSYITVNTSVNSKENLITNPLNTSDKKSYYCDEFYDHKQNGNQSIFSKNAYLNDHTIEPRSEIDMSAVSNNN